jgi:flavin-binding protein dodecin
MDGRVKQLTDRLISTALLYATDEKVEIEKSALRLVELCGGDRVALDSAHRVAVARAGDDPRDAINRRAVSITRRAVERGGVC